MDNSYQFTIQIVPETSTPRGFSPDTVRLENRICCQTASWRPGGGEKLLPVGTGWPRGIGTASRTVPAGKTAGRVGLDNSMRNYWKSGGLDDGSAQETGGHVTRPSCSAPSASVRVRDPLGDQVNGIPHRPEPRHQTATDLQRHETADGIADRSWVQETNSTELIPEGKVPNSLRLSIGLQLIIWQWIIS